MTDRERVSFTSGTVNLRGYMYLPGGSDLRPVPCVVLAHGFSGTVDRWAAHATHFADGGIATVIFDYRNFDESEGEPRQLVEIAGQQQDIRSAVEFVRRRPEIDPERVALFGNSLGGPSRRGRGRRRPPHRAVIAQIPYNGFPKRKDTRRSLGRKPEMKLLAAIFWDALRAKLHLKPYYIQTLGRPGELAVGASENA